jgi:hypothetical protein
MGIIFLAARPRDVVVNATRVHIRAVIRCLLRRRSRSLSFFSRVCAAKPLRAIRHVMAGLFGGISFSRA